jgi:hypothetical protein
VLAAAFERLARRGLLVVSGRTLVVPWEAWPRLTLVDGPGRAGRSA